MKLDLYNMDCMELMAKYDDNHFDLAIVDPPYGIGAEKKHKRYSEKLQGKKTIALSKDYGNQEWDSAIPNDEYFEELKRVSKKQIVWGANFFNLQGGMLYWHKEVTMPSFSQGELAWLSWLNKIDFVHIAWNGMYQHDMKNKEVRIHPTQKPVKLYSWILNNYAKKGDKILDTHLGSGSIAIACHDMDFDLVGCEIDKEYYDNMMERVNEHKKQLKLF